MNYLGQYDYDTTVAAAASQRADSIRVKRAFMTLATTVAGVIGGRSLSKSSKTEWSLIGGLIGGLSGVVLGNAMYPEETTPSYGSIA